MIWRVYWKGGSSQKYYISGKLWNGDPVKLPGYSDKKETDDLMANIESLNRSKKFGRLPDEYLAGWITGLPDKQAQKYVELGLLDRSLLDKNRPLELLLDEYLFHLKANNRISSLQPQVTVNRLRRLVTAIGIGITPEKLTKDQIMGKLNTMTVLSKRKRQGHLLSQKSRREYFLAMKAFCNWMVVNKRSPSNPIIDVNPPSAKGDPIHNRRPMSVADFTKLTDYLRTAPLRRRNGYVCTWTPHDRLMTYWMAVMTGFRARELKSLTYASLNFEVSPATATVKGHIAKNGEKATIPLDADLTVALREYCCEKQPTDALFNMPSLNSVTAWFYRDLDAAGIRRRFDDGSLIDFHALRSTAICWWLTINEMNLKKVQFMARLKTLALVEQYSKGYQPEHSEVLGNGPKLLDPKSLFKRAI